MRKIFLLLSAAAMAATMPAIAKERPGHGKGGGHGQAESRGHGNGHARGGGNGNGRSERAVRPIHRSEQARVRGNGQARQAERRAVRDAARGNDPVGRGDRRTGDRDWNGWLDARSRGGDRPVGDRFAHWREGRPLPLALAQGGCPPGLAKQNAFCMPPGQLRKARMVGQPLARNRYLPVPDEWLYRFRDDDDFYYRYDEDGFIYRLDRETDFVSSIFPLLATGLSVGEPLPLGYEVYNLPGPYRDHYVDNDDWQYRYDDGAIYRVDNDSGLIEGIVALLTDTPLSVGAPLPAGYDIYNLPLDYRDQYADGADSLYRYANGGIYQIDPETMLVRALIEMVV